MKISTAIIKNTMKLPQILEVELSYVQGIPPFGAFPKKINMWKKLAFSSLAVHKGHEMESTTDKSLYNMWFI